MLDLLGLEKTKLLLGVDNEKVDIIYDTIYDNLLSRLKRSLPDVETVPQRLSYIVMELTIRRYNRLGSEGLASESVEGHSANYKGLLYDFSEYEEVIRDYINEKVGETSKTGRVFRVL